MQHLATAIAQPSDVQTKIFFVRAPSPANVEGSLKSLKCQKSKTLAAADALLLAGLDRPNFRNSKFQSSRNFRFPETDEERLVFA